MTKAERRASFQAAKKAVMASIKDNMKACRAVNPPTVKGKPRPDIGYRIEWDMDLFLREVRRIKFEDWIKI